ncbi:probable thiamin pyrophosphokinase [Rhynchosporium agropyri]|uniref:Probable thiamin pyrophosphokinase n=1 Tax=Rhynchosporium agropyri TaxID=914238 RepID=A0A1E1K1P2_9HELO|nr:probable thiamin pyrophosphokinase [Rhynchosporium agropyri]
MTEVDASMARERKTNLQVIDDCDNFPYPKIGATGGYEEQVNSLWKLFLPNDPRPHGFLLDSVVEAMPWTEDFRLDHSKKEVHLVQKASPLWEALCSSSIDTLLDTARSSKSFSKLGKKRDEKYSIVGANFPIGIERSASSLFGIIGQGAHMTISTRTEEGLKFWIPQRNINKSTYPGMLDNAVAGGIAAGENAFECLVREASEEAGIDETFIRDHAKPGGTVTWFNISDVRAGGEIGLMNPGVLFVFDLEVAADMVLKPVDDDINAFHLMSVHEVQEAIGEGKFKPSSASVMIDFFVRHGILTADTDKDYVDIVSRLHRRLPFPTSPHC